MPKLTGTTIVTNPVTYMAEVLPAGSDLPDWAVGLVGSHLLHAEPEPDDPDQAEPEAPAAEGQADTQPAEPEPDDPDQAKRTRARK